MTCDIVLKHNLWARCLWCQTSMPEKCLNPCCFCSNTPLWWDKAAQQFKACVCVCVSLSIFYVFALLNHFCLFYSLKGRSFSQLSSVKCFLLVFFCFSNWLKYRFCLFFTVVSPHNQKHREYVGVHLHLYLGTFTQVQCFTFVSLDTTSYF